MPAVRSYIVGTLRKRWPTEGRKKLSDYLTEVLDIFKYFKFWNNFRIFTIGIIILKSYLK